MDKTYLKSRYIKGAATFILLLSGFGITEGRRAEYPPVGFTELPVTEWRKDSLHLEFAASLGRKLKASESVTVRPVYVVGPDTLRFRTVTFASPSETGFRRRRQSMRHVSPDGDVLVQGKELLRVNYSWTERVPYYGQGRLVVLTEMHNCCDPVNVDWREVFVASDPRLERPAVQVPLPVEEPPVDHRFLAEDMPVKEVEMPEYGLPTPVEVSDVQLFEGNVSLFRPVAEQQKHRSGKAVARLEFPVSRWDILSDFRNNYRELSRLDSLMAPVASDKDTYTVNSVRISAFASPEDTWHNNLELSRKRAASVRSYIIGKHGIAPKIVSSVGKGEDWDGLRAAVAASAMPMREVILSIIDNYGIFNGREKYLMDLQGGRPYNDMLRNIFPKLRRMEMEIEYTVRPYSRKELEEVIESRPVDMSLREMWVIACEANNDEVIRKNRASYGGEYYLMAKYFPDNVIANINAASAALIRGDLESAGMYLSRVSDSPLAANDLGLYYYLCGKEEEARAYFNIARAVDPERAQKNLRLLDNRNK